MIYFTIHQDKRILNAPEVAFTKKDMEELKAFPTKEQVFQPKIIYVKSTLTNRIDYPDFIDAPILLVSEKLKSLVSNYQKNIWMRTIVLINEQDHQQQIYYAIYPPKLPYISKQSVFNQGQQLEKFILDETKVGYNRIFIAEGMERYLIIRLDVAESVLRRNVNGIIFKEIKNEDKRDEVMKNE